MPDTTDVRVELWGIITRAGPLITAQFIAKYPTGNCYVKGHSPLLTPHPIMIFLCEDLAQRWHNEHSLNALLRPGYDGGTLLLFYFCTVATDDIVSKKKKNIPHGHLFYYEFLIHGEFIFVILQDKKMMLSQC